MTHNCPKLEKYLFPGISGCFFAPGTGGPSESSCPEGSEYVWQRGAGSQKCLVMATLNQFPAIGKGLIKSRPQSGIFDSLHPFCHTNSELSGHKIHQDPCTWGKNAPRNAWKQILFKFWAIVGHSVPPPYFRIISSKVFRSRLLLGHSSKNASPVSPRNKR